jgi:hypothetical protein
LGTKVELDSFFSKCLIPPFGDDPWPPPGDESRPPPGDEPRPPHVEMNYLMYFVLVNPSS